MKATNNIQVSYGASIQLTEIELRALEAMVGYGYDSFIKAFKEKLGSHYMNGYEKGMKQLFEDVRDQVGPALRKIDRLRDDATKQGL